MGVGDAEVYDSITDMVADPAIDALWICSPNFTRLEVMEEMVIPKHVAEVGSHLKAGLENLQEKHSLIGDVRGMGLILGVELVKDRKSKEPATAEVNHLFEETRKGGLLIGKGGMYGNVLRIAPPLIAAHDHVDEALEILDAALARVKQSGAG